MKPLRVRRAGAFEKSLLIATAAVGATAALAPFETSGALGRVLGDGGSPIYFAGMALSGALGFWAVRRSQRDRAPHQIEVECRLESLALVGITVGWSGWAMAAIQAGRQAIAVTLLVGIVCVGGAVWRMIEIRRDLKKLHAAQLQPRPADPPPLAEGL